MQEKKYNYNLGRLISALQPGEELIYSPKSENDGKVRVLVNYYNKKSKRVKLRTKQVNSVLKKVIAEKK